MRAPAVCAEPGCGATNVRGSRWCEKHQTKNSYLDAQRAASVERRRDQPWQAWYSRYPWTGPGGLRALCLRRDPICKICNRAPSTVADHVKPHRGNYDLFCDAANLQGVCESCHNEKSARELATLGPHAGKTEITWSGPAAARKDS